MRTKDDQDSTALNAKPGVPWLEKLSDGWIATDWTAWLVQHGQNFSIKSSFLQLFSI
jgi:hypothetical protein